MTNSTNTIKHLRPSEPFNTASFHGSGVEPSKRPPPFSIRFTFKERQVLDREAKGKPWAEHIRVRTPFIMQPSESSWVNWGNPGWHRT